MYRLRSIDVWFNAPGVVVAYQPIGAPDNLAARQNIANNGRMMGRFTARPDNLETTPQWSPVLGWNFVASSTTRLRTGWITPGSQTVTLAIRYSNHNGGLYQFLASGDAQNKDLALSPAWGGGVNYINITEIIISPAMTNGILALSGRQGYRNGRIDGAPLVSAGNISGSELFIGCSANYGNFITANIQAIFICNCILSPAHMAQYSYQMAYCHINPNWSAWARRRMWFEVPQAGFLAAWAQHSNAQVGMR